MNKQMFFSKINIYIYIYIYIYIWRQLHKNATSNIERVLEAVPYKAATVWPPTTH